MKQYSPRCLQSNQMTSHLIFMFFDCTHYIFLCREAKKKVMDCFINILSEITEAMPLN